MLAWWKRSISAILCTSFLLPSFAFSQENQPAKFEEVVSEVRYLMANNLVAKEDAVATFASKLMKLSDSGANILEQARMYSMLSATSKQEMEKIDQKFNDGLRVIDQINTKAEKDSMALSLGDDIDETKVSAIMKNARTKINFVTANLMKSILDSKTGANFLGCSEINTKTWIGLGVLVLGTTITVIGLSKALLTEKAIIRRHDRARNRVNRKMDKQDAIIVETEERLIKEKAQLEKDIAFYEDLKAQGVQYYTDNKGNYVNVDDKLSALNTDMYWCNEELGNIPHYWWEDNTDRFYQLQDVMDDQVEDIENLSRTHNIGYVMTGAGAAILTAGAVTTHLGLKNCR